MNRPLGVINLLLGAYIAWQAWQQEQALGGRPNDLLQTSQAQDPLT